LKAITGVNNNTNPRQLYVRVLSEGQKRDTTYSVLLYVIGKESDTESKANQIIDYLNQKSEAYKDFDLNVVENSAVLGKSFLSTSSSTNLPTPTTDNEEGRNFTKAFAILVPVVIGIIILAAVAGYIVSKKKKANANRWRDDEDPNGIISVPLEDH